MINDEIRTKVLNVEGATRTMGAAKFSGWEALRGELRRLTRQGCLDLVNGIPERTPNADVLYVCDVSLPSGLDGNLAEIAELSKAEVVGVLRTYGFAVDSDRVAVMVHYVSGQLCVKVFAAKPAEIPDVGTFLFLKQRDEPMSGFPLNPANGSLELTGSANPAGLANRRHRYPLRLGPDYQSCSWVRFRSSNGGLQACFLLPDAHFQLVIDQSPKKIDATDEWQDLPDQGVLRVRSELDSVDVQFTYCRPRKPDVGRLIEFHIDGVLYPAYSRVEARGNEYLKYYDCFNDRAANRVQSLFHKQNELINQINSRTCDSLGIKAPFEPISVAESITISDFLADTAIPTRLAGEATSAEPPVTRDDGSLVVSSQVVLTTMHAMERMRDEPIAQAPGDCESMLRPMAAALDIAHADLCFHGDIKPDNVCRDLNFPQWLTLIDTESFSSPGIPSSSSVTTHFADPEHRETLEVRKMPAPEVLMKSDRRGFVAVILATWIGRGAANQVFKHRSPLASAAARVLPKVSDRQTAVFEVLETFSKRTDEHNGNWCTDLLAAVENAVRNARTGGGSPEPVPVVSGRNAADIKAILLVVQKANADSLVAEARAELNRRVGRRVQRLNTIRWAVSGAIVVVMSMMLFVILGGA